MQQKTFNTDRSRRHKIVRTTTTTCPDRTQAHMLHIHKLGHTCLRCHQEARILRRLTLRWKQTHQTMLLYEELRARAQFYTIQHRLRSTTLHMLEHQLIILHHVHLQRQFVNIASAVIRSPITTRRTAKTSFASVVIPSGTAMPTARRRPFQAFCNQKSCIQHRRAFHSELLIQHRHRLLLKLSRFHHRTHSWHATLSINNHQLNLFQQSLCPFRYLELYPDKLAANKSTWARTCRGSSRKWSPTSFRTIRT